MKESTGAISSIYMIIFFILIMFGFIVSTIPAVISFIPLLEKAHKKTGDCEEDDNLLFFRDIAKYTYKEYLNALIEKYFDGETDIIKINGLELDYAKEITYNSFVASRKYYYFSLAVKIQISIWGLFIILLIMA